MKKLSILALAAIFAFISCNKDNGDKVAPQQGAFTLEIALDQTKTSLSEAFGTSRNIYWSDGDAIILNGLSSQELANVPLNCTSSSFTFSNTPTLPYNLAYPAGACEGNIMNLPAVQTYTEGTFASNVFPMLGYVGAQDGNVIMRNAAAVVHLTVKGSESLYKIFFAGRNNEQVCGPFTMDFENAVLTPAGDGSFVTVNVQGTTLTEDGVEFFISVPAQQYSKGFVIRIETADGTAVSYMDFANVTDITLEKGKIYNYPAITFVSEGNPADADTPVFVEDFSGGTGTEFNPYRIDTVDDLVALAAKVESDNAKYGAAHYKQTSDIDLASVENFGMIGKSTDKPFKGTYDGNGKKISNLVINQTEAAAKVDIDKPHAAFFAFTTDAAISNLTFENPVITNAAYYSAVLSAVANNTKIKNCIILSATVNNTGENSSSNSYGAGFVAQATGCTIEDSSFSGNISVKDHRAGAIAAEINGNTSITRCSFDAGTLKGNWYVGGIVGIANNEGGKIESCITSGNVNSGTRAGGIVSSLNLNCIVENCTLAKGASIAGTGNDGGGIAAYVKGGIVRNSTCLGSVKASGNAGGIVGTLNTGTITGCVTASGSSIEATNSQAGGLVGYAGENQVSVMSISKCAVYSASVKCQHREGGLIGYTQFQAGGSLTVADCLVLGADLSTTGANYNAAFMGGIIGWINSQDDGQSFKNIAVYDISMSATGAQENGTIGGLVGQIGKKALFDNCVTNLDSKAATYKGVSVTTALNSKGVALLYWGGLYGRCSAAATFNSCHWDNTMVKAGVNSPAPTLTECVSHNSADFQSDALLATLNNRATVAELSSWSKNSSGYPIPAGVPSDVQ